MSCQTEHSWSLYHCRLSFALNSKMLHPLDVITSAIDAYQAAPERISLPQIEGFIRQILGWREFVRGIYWCNMPKYESLNSLHATRPLPDYFWHGETQMQCMQQAIKQSLRFGYAHHIQRLMVTGNFCLLTGIAPDDVDAWYLGIYVDALQWVELPNTRGMSQFADGGIIATKPYVASGNYLNKMSDYCQHCHYNVKNKVGPDACPFNSLYWHFLQRHEALFSNNPRMTILYRQWYRQDEATRHAILTQAEQYLLTLNAL